jgi:hypothetical protein
MFFFSFQERGPLRGKAKPPSDAWTHRSVETSVKVVADIQN